MNRRYIVDVETVVLSEAQEVRSPRGAHEQHHAYSYRAHRICHIPVHTG